MRWSRCSYVERGAGGDSGCGDDEVQDQHRGPGEADAEEPGAAVLYDGVHDILQPQASTSQCHLLHLACRCQTLARGPKLAGNDIVRSL